MDVVVGRTEEVDPRLLRLARQMMDRAFAGDYDETDWEHGLGGHHVLVVEDGAVVAHASVVRRTLWVGDQEVPTGYVESVATEPAAQGRGRGTVVMAEIGDLIREDHALGALGTGAHGFYERLGWERWRGPTYVRRPDGDERTADEDDGIMVLRTPASSDLDLALPLTCEERNGDDW